MFGDNYLKNAKFSTTKEGFEAHALASKAVDELAKATGRGWHLTSHEAFDHVRVKSFIEGAGVAALGMLAGVGIQTFRKIRLEKKIKRLEEENRRLEEEAGA